MTEWKEVLLTDITTKIGDGLHGTPKYDNGGEYYFINGNNLVNGKILIKEDTKRVNKSEYLKHSKPINERTLLLGINGTIGNVAYYKNEKCILGKSACYLNLNDEVDLKFIYYTLVNKDFQNYIVGIATGTTIPNVPLKGLREYSFKIPPLPEQKSIASILSCLDDKIDLLHRQNATLEKMAETLFRQWFVEEAKEDWETVKITDLFEVRDGTHDSPKQKEFGKKLITSKHLSKHSIDFETAYFISEEDFEQINKRSKVDTGDILFSMIGTIGIIYLEQSNEIDYAIKNIGLFKTSQNPLWKYFTVLWLKSDFGNEFIFENRSGSTQEYISLGSLRNITFSIPSLETVKEFNKEVETLFQKIKSNQTQIHTLTALRDTLLPKLMSGEITVAE